jgi:beta-1,4-galactosyltransferase 1
LKTGGLIIPTIQTTFYKVAIIVPFRDKAAHLKKFTEYMHPFLKQQKITYQIYVIEQEKGLANIKSWLFHDVDLLPKSQNTTYKCQSDPYHMASAIDKFQYALPYEDNSGGCWR